ncbi:MAG: hypothetical protein GX185_06270 [Tissierellia bacterium]|nr:hypothetical protein [Tissierellia bacterium]
MEDVVSNPEEIANNDKTLVKTGELELKYAKSFSVEYFEGGYKILTDGNGDKTILIPVGKEVPELDEDIKVVHQPVKKVGPFSTVNMTMLRALDSIDMATIVTTPLDGWYVDDVIERMESGQITFVG